MLTEQNKLRWQDLRLTRHNEWNDFEGPGGPITGVVGPILDTIMNAGTGMASRPINTMHTVHHRASHKAKKRKIEQKRKKKLEEINGGAVQPKKASLNGTTNKPARPELDRNITGASTLSADPEEPIVEELAKETGHGLGKAGKGIVTLPINLMVGITQGFHNAPRLYGDDTVRRPVRVSGFKSGLRAGRDELVYGVYDGWTGDETRYVDFKGLNGQNCPTSCFRTPL